MALQSSGAISLSQIAAEFGGSIPHSLSEYYGAASGVPSSGSISFSDFYGTSNIDIFTISSSQQELNLETYLTGLGWNGSTPVVLTIDSGVYLWSNSTSTAGLIISSAFNNKLTIYNSGYIIGKGGDGGTAGAGSAGGPALSNSATGVIFTNNSGAYIAGGGGGGGSGTGGGGGGAGGGHGGNGTGEASNATGGAGGSIGASGANGNYYEASIYAGGGGGAGGGGAGWVDKSNDSYDSSSGGGGGGRILPGSGGSAGYNGYIGPYNLLEGGAGGSANGSGGNGSSGAGGGGGGWGASGGGAYYAGGAGGAAISGTAIASLTNNGTIYGSYNVASSGTVSLTYEIIGAGGGGGGGWTSVRSASAGEASTISYGGMTITSSGGAAGATTANTGQSDGSPTHYGPGGSGGANSDSSRQTAGYPAPTSSYGAGGGGGGANPFSARNGGWGGFSGGQHLSAYAFIVYPWNTSSGAITRYTGQPHTGTIEVTPGSTVSIYVGVNGFGTDAEAYGSADPGTDGRKGAGGYCKVTVSGSSSEFTTSGSHTYTVPS